VRALSTVGFQPVGVVIGNSATHIARPMALAAGNRLNTFSRSFSGDAGAVVPPAIQRAQAGEGDGGPDLSGQGEAGDPPFLAKYECPHLGNRPSLRGRRLTNHFPGYNWELPQLGTSFTDCFNHALSRLMARAVERAAHGVVDIRMEISGDEMLQGNVEITLTGTAIANPSPPASVARPSSSC
jgi:hypothetical protein